MNRVWTALALAALLAGCKSGGDGEGGTTLQGCIGSFFGGTVNFNATSCSGTCRNPQRPQHAIDGQRDSYAEFTMGGSGTRIMGARAQSGIVYPAGSFAGALMVIPTEYTGSAWTISTYQDDLLLESRTPENASGGDPNLPGGEDEYYGFITTMPFNRVQLTFTGGTPSLDPPEIRVYEICGQR